MKERSVHVTLYRDGRVFFFTYSDCVNGPSVSVGLPEVVTSIDDAARLGEVLIQQLRESNRTVLPACNWRTNPPDQDLLRWLGLKTYGQFMRGVRSVAVSAIFDEIVGDIEITPERNGGARGGFVPIETETARLSSPDPEQLGRAVQQAMARATV